MPRTPGDPRDTRAWRKLRDQVVEEEPTCRIRLPGCTEISETADHIIPVAIDVSLAMERSNHRGACHWCNRRRKVAVEELVTRLALAPDALSFFE